MIRLTPDQQKKGAAYAIFAVFVVGILYYNLHDATPAPPPPPVITTSPSVKTTTAAKNTVAVPPGNVAGKAAKNVGTTSAQLDPTLRMDAMLVTESLVYSGNGRNIFSANSAPVEIPKPIAPARKVAAVAPPPVVPLGPPPPPPIELKFFGVAMGANGKRMAFLLHGDDVFVATDGEIVQRRYKVISVGANSVVVEDLSYNNRQTLPLPPMAR
jgi:hypothetical protein